MPIEFENPFSNLNKNDRFQLIEGVTLLVVTPFFLFPERFPVLTILAATFLGFLWFVSAFWFKKPFRSGPLNLSLLIFSLGFLIGVLVSADPALTLPKAAGLLLGLAVYRWVVGWGISANRVVLLTGGILLVSAGLMVYGFLNVNWLVKITAFLPIYEALPFGTIDLAGNSQVGIHSNQLAGSLLLFMFIWPWIGVALWQNKRKWLGMVCGSVFLLWTAALILTQSRAGWFAFLGGSWAGLWLWSFLMGQANYKRVRAVRWALIFASAAALLGAAVLLGPDSLKNFYQAPSSETVIGDLNSLAFRQEVWRWAIVGVQDFSLTGTGLGTFREVARRLYPLNVEPGYDFAHAHNIFLQTWLDIGLLGLLGYLALILGTCSRGLELLRRRSRWNFLTIGLLANLVGFHIFGMVDTLALGSKTHILFWLNIGLIGAIGNLELPASDEP